MLKGNGENRTGDVSRWCLRYGQPAPDDIDGWEQYSLPIGNGYFGVSVFGGIEEERLQLTDKTFFNDDASKPEQAWDRRALTSFADVRIRSTVEGPVDDYERTLDLERAVATVRYRIGSVGYCRELFTSYPDRVMVMRITATEKRHISLSICPELPCLDDIYRSGRVTVEGTRIRFGGEGKTFGLIYEGLCEVQAAGGSLQALPDGIAVHDADEVLILVTIGTNYRLQESVFLEGQPAQKLAGFPSPYASLERTLAAASSQSWGDLLARHLADYQPLFDRVDLQLGDETTGPDIPTDTLLAQYQEHPGHPYLEALYFQYGRYLLIASSRANALPANLQGTWNAHPAAPWTGGYWANINLQMNYWPVFNTNLRELYEPFMDYFEATMARQCVIARNEVRAHNPSALEEDCGWTAGTANNPYFVSGPGTVSGFGTGPFVVQNMWAYFMFTDNMDVLRRIWPFLRASSLFTSKIVRTIPGYGDLLLCDPSWSPELQDPKTGVHYNMPGSTYDQSLIYQGHQYTLEAASRLGITDDPLLAVIREQLPRLDPVPLGDDGQIKEFRQEGPYGEFGESNHRHISQLVGLFPGSLISSHKPDWLAAARVTLERRGDRSTGWAMAHRLNAWARLRDASRTYKLLQTLLEKGTLPNLWDTHPPFQIDGNFGGTAGIAEMLLQSHEGFIRLLPACPAEWATGRFRGLVAHGAIEVSAEWQEGRVNTIDLRASTDRECRLLLDDPAAWTIDDPRVTLHILADGVVFFQARGGIRYRMYR